MSDATIVCCGQSLQEDSAVHEKWVCPCCGRVFAVVGKRFISAFSGGEAHG